MESPKFDRLFTNIASNGVVNRLAASPFVTDLLFDGGIGRRYAD
jgi:hypothetical protein